MGNLSDQVRAVRQSAGLLDEFPRKLLAVRGHDRVKFLHNLVTHDIKGLGVGQERQACLLDRQGKIRAAFLVHARQEELLLEMDPSQFQPAREALEKFLVSEEVEFSEVTDRYRILPLHGPAAAEILAEALSEGPTDSGICFIHYWNLFHRPGVHLWVKPESEPAVRKRVLKTGGPFHPQAIGKEAFEILRIEAGIPWPGAEMDETVILNELGTEEFVSFTKGCFIGQEIVARIKYRAHPPRLLKGFLIEGNAPAKPKSPLLLSGETVGTITSSCFSPTLNQPIALGFLNFGIQQTRFTAQHSHGAVPATLTQIPFVT